MTPLHYYYLVHIVTSYIPTTHTRHIVHRREEEAVDDGVTGRDGDEAATPSLRGDVDIAAMYKR